MADGDDIHMDEKDHIDMRMAADGIPSPFQTGMEVDQAIPTEPGNASIEVQGDAVTVRWAAGSPEDSQFNQMYEACPRTISDPQNRTSSWMGPTSINIHSDGESEVAHTAFHTATWATLPGDIMAHIMKFVPSNTTRIMRVVCQGWNRSVGASLRYVQPETLKHTAYLEHFPNVLTLDASNADLKVSCTSGREISLVSAVDDTSVENIAKLHSLHSIYLTNCVFLNGTFLQAFRNLPNLELLDLSGCSSIHNGHFIEHIAHMKHLKSISLVGCWNLNDASVAVAAQSLNQLKRIAVPPTTTDLGLHCIATSPSIERVAIRACDQITTEGIKALLRTPTLQRVVVSKCKNISSNTLRQGTRNLSVFKYETEDWENRMKSRRRSLNMELTMNCFYN